MEKILKERCLKVSLINSIPMSSEKENIWMKELKFKK